jgi:tripartite-type tricarboxylate transporter receptor subunit TctC
MFITVNAITALVEKSQLKALATAETKRLATLPDLPTLAEAGVPSVEFNPWYGLLAKAGIPAAVQLKISEALLEIVNEPDTRDRIIGAGFELSPDGPEETQRLLNAELDKWAQSSKESA